MKFRYVVRNLRAIADMLEDDKNLKAGDMEGASDQLTEMAKLIRGAMQYVGEWHASPEPKGA
jgi:hypothetical protein